MTQHTKESITKLLETNDKAVCRALVVLFERQTADEQTSAVTKHRNGMGFNGYDAGFGSWLAKQIMNWEAAPDRKYAHPLGRMMIDKARRMVYKYAGQLAEVANVRVTA